MKCNHPVELSISMQRMPKTLISVRRGDEVVNECPFKHESEMHVCRRRRQIACLAFGRVAKYPSFYGHDLVVSSKGGIIHFEGNLMKVNFK